MIPLRRRGWHHPARGSLPSGSTCLPHLTAQHKNWNGILEEKERKAARHPTCLRSACSASRSITRASVFGDGKGLPNLPRPKAGLVQAGEIPLPDHPPLRVAFLCADLGITPEIREDHAAYLGHWLTVLKEDKRAIFSAVAHAQRAADFLNSLQPQQEQESAAA